MGFGRKAKALPLPPFPNYSRVSTLTHSPSIRESVSVSFVAVRVRPSRALFRSTLSERLSRSRSSEAGGFFERRASGRSPARRRGWRGGEGEGRCAQRTTYAQRFKKAGAGSQRQIKPVHLLLINVCVEQRSWVNEPPPPPHILQRIRVEGQFVRGKGGPD